MEMNELRIFDVCSAVYSGGTPNKKHTEYYIGGNIPWLNTSEIKFNRIFRTEKFITEKGLASSSAKYVPENTVIVAMYGATAARTAIAKIPLTTNQACCNLIIDEQKADYRYVYYWLCSKYTQLTSLANGGAQQNLNAGQIKDFPIFLPDLDKQVKISNLLSVLDDQIYNNTAINENL
ncbi:MAG: restriction endonuclease subunit S, partial [bacterium]|nr:restriction endonuclease subunit S [bacterium]